MIFWYGYFVNKRIIQINVHYNLMLHFYAFKAIKTLVFQFSFDITDG